MFYPMTVALLGLVMLVCVVLAAMELVCYEEEDVS